MAGYKFYLWQYLCDLIYLIFASISFHLFPTMLLFDYTHHFIISTIDTDSSSSTYGTVFNGQIELTSYIYDENTIWDNLIWEIDDGYICKVSDDHKTLKIYDTNNVLWGIYNLNEEDEDGELVDTDYFILKITEINSNNVVKQYDLNNYYYDNDDDY